MCIQSAQPTHQKHASPNVAPTTKKAGVSGIAARPGANPPPFTFADLKNKIPAHCFERSTLHSTAYLLADLAFVLTLHYILHNYWNPSMLPAPLSYVAWFAYAWVQGAVMTGLWVIAHECGHQAYSESGVINDTVGFIVHSALGVPYFSWKISHGKHHSKTGNIDLDEVFVPSLVEDAEHGDHPLKHTIPMRLYYMFLMLFVGWPAYLSYNATAHKTPDFVSHFLPKNSLFTAREQKLVILSDLGLLVTIGGLYYWAQQTSYTWVALVYVFPLLFTNMWLVIITGLQHTHKDVPHYDSTSWTWLRGALLTVDRDYGLGNIIFHHIADTHIVHHLFSRMPHYHAQEATEAIREFLGDYYLYDNTGVFKSLWINTLECWAVRNDGTGTYWFERSQFTKKLE